MSKYLRLFSKKLRTGPRVLTINSNWKYFFDW